MIAFTEFAYVKNSLHALVTIDQIRFYKCIVLKESPYFEAINTEAQ